MNREATADCCSLLLPTVAPLIYGTWIKVQRPAFGGLAGAPAQMQHNECVCVRVSMRNNVTNTTGESVTAFCFYLQVEMIKTCNDNKIQAPWAHFST